MIDVLMDGFMCTISIQLGEFEMMVVYNNGDGIQIDMCIPVTVDAWTICYIILGSFVIIEIGYQFFGCRPIAFGQKRVGIGNRSTVLIW